MKISQLVATKTAKPYHESVASRLPRGIKSQQHLLNLGYGVAVRDLGLSKAKTLDENFAIKLVNSYHRQCLDEGVGSFLGKVAGNVIKGTSTAVQGAKGAWQGAKDAWQQGKDSGTYDKARAAVSGIPTDQAARVGPQSVTQPAPQTAPAGSAPAAGGATAGGSDRPYVAPAPTAARTAPGAAATAPAPAGGGDIGSIIQAIDKLDKPSKQQLAGDLEKSIASTPDPATADPVAGKTPEEAMKDPRYASDPAFKAEVDKAAAIGTPPTAKPDELDAVKKNAGLPAGTPPASAAPQGQSLDLDQLKKDKEAKLAAGQADQQQAQQQMAATQQANAATSQQDAAIKAASDAAKAKPAFQQSASDKLAIKQAADKGIKEAEEVAEGFHSNFLGMKI